MHCGSLRMRCWRLVWAFALASLFGLASAWAADCAGTGLLEKTQSFSDAGQRGDGATMAKMLDDRVVFFNEGGDAATKADMAQAASGPAPGVSINMTVDDFNCQRHGNVAVTSFSDDQVIKGPAPSHARY